jgi:hypothetical protein
LEATDARPLIDAKNDSDLTLSSEDDDRISLDDNQEQPTKRPKLQPKLPACKLALVCPHSVDLLNLKPLDIHQALNAQPTTSISRKHELVTMLTSYQYAYKTSPQQQQILKQALTVRIKTEYHSKELEYYKQEEMKFKQAFHHLYTTLDSSTSFWYHNTIFVCKFTQTVVDVFGFTKGLLEILEKQGIRFKIVCARDSMLQVEDVHSFYDYLFSWQDIRIDYRVASLPTLISRNMFAGCSVQVCKIDKMKTVKKIDGSVVYAGCIEGLVGEWYLDKLVLVLENEGCNVKIDYIGK